MACFHINNWTSTLAFLPLALLETQPVHWTEWYLPVGLGTLSSGTIASLRGYSLAPLVWGSGALIALSTGYLRIAADKHYLSDVLTGLVIGGTAPKRVLLRAAGPALTQFGLTTALARPALTVFSGSTPLATNTGWSTSADSVAIAEAAAAKGQALPPP